MSDQEQGETAAAPVLGRDDILGIDDLPKEDVYVPDWGGYVRVSALTAFNRDKLEEQLAGDKPDWSNFRARWAVKCMIDQEGNRLFKDNEANQLGRKSAKAMQTVFAAIQRLSGLTQESVEETEGNSDAVQSGGSSSDSA